MKENQSCTGQQLWAALVTGSPGGLGAITPCLCPCGHCPAPAVPLWVRSPSGHSSPHPGAAAEPEMDREHKQGWEECPESRARFPDTLPAV